MKPGQESQYKLAFFNISHRLQKCKSILLGVLLDLIKYIVFTHLQGTNYSHICMWCWHESMVKYSISQTTAGKKTLLSNIRFWLCNRSCLGLLWWCSKSGTNISHDTYLKILKLCNKLIGLLIIIVGNIICWFQDNCSL